MEVSFEGKRALVTGAAGELGKAITYLLVKYKAIVVATDIRGDELRSIYKDNPQVIPVECDLSDWGKSQEMVKSQLPINLLVNNAGISLPMTFDKVDNKAVDKLFSINMKPIISVSQIVIMDLIAREVGGAIVNMSSNLSRGGTLFMSMYSASKAAVSSLTESMAVEYSKHGIRVNAVRPGPVKTPLMQAIAAVAEMPDEKLLEKTPTAKFTVPQDVARAVVFLLSDLAGNMTGTSITVDGGMNSVSF